MRIGLQADDARRADQIARVLGKAGHSVTRVSTAVVLREAVRRDSFDLVIFEWTGGDAGAEFLTRMREIVPEDTPVVGVTGSAHGGDVAAALNAGAAELRIMPMGGALLTARIEAVRRRCRSRRGSTSVELFGDYRFNPAARSIACRSAALPATAKEFALALLLFRNLDRTLSRTHLMETVWGYAGDAERRTLDAHVSVIRRRLRLLPINGLRIACSQSLSWVGRSR